ncbi:hypothetical protein FDUTEX481_06026 [Tolypothrix sp. PCC 7601]|nr:hypothetical protein FDUTEX481_06026 [Tolypothrix sp. PCC 7601]
MVVVLDKSEDNPDEVLPIQLLRVEFNQLLINQSLPYRKT